MKILNQKGQGLTEYLILLLLIAVSSVTVAKTFGNTIRSKISEAERHVNSISADAN